MLRDFTCLRTAAEAVSIPTMVGFADCHDFWKLHTCFANSQNSTRLNFSSALSKARQEIKITIQDEPAAGDQQLVDLAGDAEGKPKPPELADSVLGGTRPCISSPAS